MLLPSLNHNFSSSFTMAQSTTLEEFEAIYPKLEAALLDDAKALKLPQAEYEWYKKVRSFKFQNSKKEKQKKEERG